MGKIRKAVRFILGPNFLRDRPADQTQLTAGPFTGSERMIKTDDSSQAGDAAREVRRQGNFSR